MAKNTPPVFSKELLDELLSGRDPKTALDSGGLIGDLKKALAERMLNAEMDVLGPRGRNRVHQPSQRQQREDGADARRGTGAIDPQRSAWPLRSSTDRQISSALSRLR